MSLSSYLKSSPKTHLIFDFDNTLFRLHLPWHRWDERMRKDLIDLDQSIYQTYLDSHKDDSAFVIGISQLQNDYVKKHGQKALDVITKNNQEFEVNDQTGVTPNQHLVDFILHNSKYSYSLWSTNTSHAIIPVLDQHGLTPTFNHIITRNEVTFVKPDPQGFVEFIHDSRTPVSQYLMIGDSSADQQAAKNAGIDFYQVTMD